MSLRPWGACHTCRGAHVCVLKCRPCVIGTPKVVPWCPLGAVKAFPWCSLLELPTPPLKSNIGCFHCFWRRHQYVWGDIMEYLNKYKINQIPKISLYTNSIAWCAHGACLARPWCTRNARLARPWCAPGSPLVQVRCASSSPAVSSLSSWGLNHQTSKLSLLSA